MSAEDLMARIEQARSGLQTSRNLLTDARGVQIPERIGYEKAQGVLESINRHTGDFFTGAFDVVEETVSDVLNTITNPLEALEDTVKGTIDAIENPGEALDALTEPYREAWNEGRPGEAIGRGFVEVGSVFLGGTGAVRAAVRVARKGGGNDGADGDGDSDNDDGTSEDNQDSGETGETLTYPDKSSARQALSGDQQIAANRFFRDATSKSENFKTTDIGNGNQRLEFFSPANNPGYGKWYVQEIDSDGNVIREYKDTIGPTGLIERKWIHGGPK